jgi:hypothetical protein
MPKRERTRHGAHLSCKQCLPSGSKKEYKKGHNRIVRKRVKDRLRNTPEDEGPESVGDAVHRAWVNR